MGDTNKKISFMTCTIWARLLFWFVFADGSNKRFLKVQRHGPTVEAWGRLFFLCHFYRGVTLPKSKEGQKAVDELE